MSFLEHLKSGLFFSPAFSLQSQVTYEPLRVPLRQPHKKHVMSDEGLYLEQLYGKAEFEGLMAYGGKFDLPVSLVADTAPGIFGGDYATDYQLREMLGAGGVLHLTPREWGSHSFGIVGFAADTSLLDAAAFTQPNFGSTDTARTGRLHQGNGGEANTGAPQSKLLTLDGDGTALALPTLTYHLAWASLRHGVGETKNQIDLVGAVQYTGDLGAGVAIHPLLEASRIYNDGGSPVSSGSSIPASQRADYLTTGVELTWRSWSISAVHAQRFFIEPKNGSGLDGRSSFEHMTTEAIGYAFDWGVSTAIAWKHDHSLAPDSTLNVTTDSIGLLINYHQDF
ncbi:hypothetical protein [Telmatospirillum sp.]|uniref:hypothetical protein n=1 Tax=Telmatospirillum sp. TaxID=2079197 RepID=UPI00284F02BB|nr:hypothetical protein [Telmatospirillum sp.]MDR3440898.1 hypothetical protein [Telmatospirillum sp.]